MYQHNTRTSIGNITISISLCIAILTVVIDTSIVKIYRFIMTPISLEWDIATFTVMTIVYAVVQYILLREVRTKGLRSKLVGRDAVHDIVSIIQYVMLTLLVLIILQMTVFSVYNIAIVIVSITISYILSMATTGLLALRFFSWFRSTRNTVVLAYNIAAAMILINIGFTLVYVVQGLQDVSTVVRPHIGHITGFSAYSITLISGYLISSIVAFMTTWIATILLLRHHSKKIGRAKYWILVTIPLLYFLSQFQPSFLDLFSGYRMSTPVLFDVLYTIIFNLSKPVGGILFGVAFWIVARGVRHNAVKDYLSTAGFGLVLLFTSNQATVLINSPYPPFGMVAVSFVGLSSYLLLVGLYSSAISVAQDARLRRSIQNSVEDQADLLGKIGTAEMERKIVKNVLSVTENMSTEISEQTGIESSLDEQDIADYLSEVLKETKGIKK
jgi:hypothetical protein